MRPVRQILLGGVVSMLAATCLLAASPPQTTKPRLLVLILDGIPIRTVAKVREQGAFESWGQAVPMVSTFPSMTNVAITAMLSRHRVEPIAGYERRFFEPAPDGSSTEGLVSLRKHPYPWRQMFQITNSAVSGEAAAYVSPKRKARRMISAVEEAVLGHPAVVGACAVGLPDAEWGEKVAVAVVPVEGELDLEDLDAYAQEVLMPAKRPRRWLIVDALPLNANGKLDREAVRRRFR